MTLLLTSTSDVDVPRAVSGDRPWLVEEFAGDVREDLVNAERKVESVVGCQRRPENIVAVLTGNVQNVVNQGEGVGAGERNGLVVVTAYGDTTDDEGRALLSVRTTDTISGVGDQGHLIRIGLSHVHVAQTVDHHALPPSGQNLLRRAVGIDPDGGPAVGFGPDTVVGPVAYT